MSNSQILKYIIYYSIKMVIVRISRYSTTLYPIEGMKETLISHVWYTMLPEGLNFINAGPHVLEEGRQVLVTGLARGRSYL